MDCVYRNNIRTENGREVAECGLVASVAGCPSVAVPASACEVCVRERPVSVDHLNRVVASYVGHSWRAADVKPSKERWDWVHQFIRGGKLVDNPPAPPACSHLGEAVGSRTYAPGISLPVLSCQLHAETTAPACYACPDRDGVSPSPPPTAASATLEPAPAQPPSASSRTLAAALPPPEVRKGARVKEWAVGMTTAPRKAGNIGESIRSVQASGWEQLTIFAEPGSEIPAEFEPLAVRRPVRLGGWGNWFASLAELLMRHPQADAYMIVQDDIIFPDHRKIGPLRDHLEKRVLWPDEPDKIGFVSLWCSAAYSKVSPGWHKLEERWVWGALAMIFPAINARQMLGANTIGWHMNRQCVKGFKPHEVRRIDDTLGAWAHKEQLSTWYCCPSLIQHVGDYSTVRENQSNSGRRRADKFVGDLF